jgi:hypothetical protein
MLASSPFITACVRHVGTISRASPSIGGPRRCRRSRIRGLAMRMVLASIQYPPVLLALHSPLIGSPVSHPRYYPPPPHSCPIPTQLQPQPPTPAQPHEASTGLWGGDMVRVNEYRRGPVHHCKWATRMSCWRVNMSWSFVRCHAFTLGLRSPSRAGSDNMTLLPGGEHSIEPMETYKVTSSYTSGTTA